MDTLDLHEVGHMFSCCEPCVRNRRWKQVILVISFVLVTVDVVTDWINWVQWSGVGGYDQYYFASIFERVFLCVAAVGTGLWIIELFVIVKKWINTKHQHPKEIPPKYRRNFYNYLPKPEVNFSLSKLEVDYSDPEVRKYGEPEVKNNIDHLFELEVKNHPESGKNEDEKEDTKNCNKSLSGREFIEPLNTEPEMRNYSKFSGLELVPELNVNCNECPLDVQNDNYLEITNEDKPLSEPEVKMDGKLPPEPESKVNNDEDKPPSEPEPKGRNEDKRPSEPEPKVRNEDKPPTEPEPKVRNEDKPPSELEPKVRNEDKPPSEPEPKVRDESGPPSEAEPKVRNEDKPPSEPEPKVRNEGKPPSEPDVRNYEESGKNEEEQEVTFNGSKGISRLGILVRILVGFLEDLPVVVSVYYPTVMPMCGIPAKQSAGSGVALATIISSMLNSLWTMICLICELCGCTEGGFCCLGNKKDLNANAENTDRNPLEQSHRHETTRRHSKKHSKPCMKTVCKVVLCILIFKLFSCTFTLGFWTVGHVLGFISLRFTEVPPFKLRPYIETGYYGPGIDAKPDEAMFINLHYKLPDSHYITLNDSKLSKSTSFKNVINRLYIGQFEEQSHLKDGTLIKAIPCSRAMPFLQKIDKRIFHWVNYQQKDAVKYANCKIIFTLRYFPTNNNWQPFTNFIHDYCKCITIEYGIYIDNNKICPWWFNSPSSASFLSEQVQKDILNYTCNSACDENNGICRNVKSWHIDHNQGISSLNGNIRQCRLSFAIHNLKTPDTCWFKVEFEHLPKFCNKSWGEIEPVKVPDEIKRQYPQFITVPITTWYDKNLGLRIFENNCHELWQSEEHLEVD